GDRSGRVGAERLELGPVLVALGARTRRVRRWSAQPRLLRLVDEGAPPPELPRPGRRLRDRAPAFALHGAHSGTLAGALHRDGDRPAQLLRGPRDRPVGGAGSAEPRLRAGDRL